MKWIIFPALFLYNNTPAQQDYVDISFWKSERCLANVLYHEARGEALKAQRAVLDVVLNRAEKKGKDVCEIVFERKAFSWTARKPLLPLSQELHNMLQQAREHDIVLPDGKYLYFFSGRKPVWARNMSCQKIDRQRYCKEK